MSEIMVSVYCLCFNHEKYIRDALDGFITQKTNFNFEVIVHDDASTDNSTQIINEYTEKYPDIIKPIFQTKNKYSQGIDIIGDYIIPQLGGKYVAVCEGDDYWTDSLKLQKQFDYMENHPDCSLVTHLAKTKFENGKIIDYTNYDYSTEEKRHLKAETIITNHTIFPTNSMFYRKSYLLSNGDILNKVKRFDYVDKILLATEGDVYVIPEYMSVYRSSSEGSWTESVYSHADKWINHLENSITYLNAINIYRNYKFNDSISEEIRNREYSILCAKGNLKEIKTPKYIDLYKKSSYKQKTAILLNSYFPLIYSFLRRKLLPKIRHIYLRRKNGDTNK